jgi:hypothetical protein
MKFTFTEWQAIQHGLTVAKKSFEREMNQCKVSDEKDSAYQLFKNQVTRMEMILHRIENAEI